MRGLAGRQEGRPDPILKVLRLEPVDEPLEDQLDDSAGHEVERPDVAEAHRRGPLGLLRVLGPGLITGAADDDPSAIGTYSQAGAQAGLGLLWTGLLTLPLMMAAQELAQRIALQTGAGLGVNLKRKFPTWIVAASVALLVASNVITLGADLRAVASGIELLSRSALKASWLIVPVALVLVGFQVLGKYTVLVNSLRWLSISLVAYLEAAILSHPNPGAVLYATFVPHLELNPGFVLSLAAVLGTTLSPYLFIWQPAVEVDNLRVELRSRRARPPVDEAKVRAARVDTFAGMFFSQLVAYCIILTCATVLHVHGKTGITTAAEAAEALAPVAGPSAFVLFAAGFVGSGLLAIPVLSASSAYAVNEVAGIPGSLAGKPRRQPTFYAIIVVATGIGVLMNLLQFDVIGALVWASALSGVAAIPLLVLMTAFGRDPRFMGRSTSGRLSQCLTWIAAAGMAGATVALVAVELWP